MSFFPVFFKTKHASACVIGGGEVALRKIRLLHQFGFRIRLVALEIDPAITALLQDVSQLEPGVEHIMQRKAAEQMDLDHQDIALVISATEIQSLNYQVSLWAKQRNLPVNTVDQPEDCTFITPAIIDRQPLVIAISSGGQSPVLSRRLRAKIEAFIPSAYGRLAGLFSQYRQSVKKALPDLNMRRNFWDDIIDGPVQEMMLNGQTQEAENLLKQCIADHPMQGTKAQGEVYLVGAGPGDPDLLTFRALRLMQRADVVLYDRLVTPAIIDLCRRDAIRIYVGKAKDFHSVPQDQINQKLIDYAHEGLKVCRLKGGDPFIFGRGGEEIEGLMAENIPFQVVPGITAAAGCSTYAGIPLTHRDYAQSVAFVTGHLSASSQPTDWSAYIKPFQTLVIYMGKPGIEKTCQGLLEAGIDPEIPAALISKGTQPQQKVLVAPMKNFAQAVLASECETPTLIIIGQVVGLRSKLNWFQNVSS